MKLYLRNGNSKSTDFKVQREINQIARTQQTTMAINNQIIKEKPTKGINPIVIFSVKSVSLNSC